MSFFDSYGDFPDDQMQFINNEFLVQSGQAFNYMCRLLHKASFKYTVDHLQEEGQTCGYVWTVVLSVCVEYNGPGVDGFYWYIRDFGNPDFDEVCLELFYSQRKFN